MMRLKTGIYDLFHFTIGQNQINYSNHNKTKKKQQDGISHTAVFYSLYKLILIR